MAKTNNPILAGYQVTAATTNKQFIVKKRKGRAFIAKCPDMSNVVPSTSQLQEKSRFRDAVAYARSIINDPVKKSNYKQHPGSTVYHSAIKDYLDR